jgi:hypothetical protein
MADADDDAVMRSMPLTLPDVESRAEAALAHAIYAYSASVIAMNTARGAEAFNESSLREASSAEVQRIFRSAFAAAFEDVAVEPERARFCDRRLFGTIGASQQMQDATAALFTDTYDFSSQI